MVFITFECAPASRVNANKKFGGAFVSCWVKTHDQKEAKQFARKFVREQGWRVVKLDQCCNIMRVDYDDNHSRDGVLSFDDAERNGSSFTFHTFPKSRRKSGAR